MTRRYALVGLGSRARLYADALLGDWRDAGEIVALCDTNQTRMDHHNDRVLAAGLDPVPTFHPDAFDQVLAAADAVVVTTVDATHARYVVAALEAGKDVVVEKPMTTDAAGCAAIAEAAERGPGRLVVTFNYRYSPRNSAVRRVLAEGAIGQVTGVHFEWALDTLHGADYFRRWHRESRNSGGLLVHKSTHHFDLVNWWLDAGPELVFAQQQLRFYGDANPPAAELGPRPERSHGAPGLGTDPFLLDMAADPALKALYLDAEHEDGYHRDRDVFGPGIDISDTMSLLVRYDNGAQLTYALHAYAPWEGYRVVFNGTGGRLELEVVERAWASREAAIDPSATGHGDDDGYAERLTLHQHWQPPRDVPIEQGTGGHGGGDRLLLDDVFRGASEDPLRRQAGYLAGIRSVLTGVAGNESARTGLPVRLADGGTRLAD